MTPLTKRVLFVGVTAIAVTWTGLRLWSARELARSNQQSVISNQQSQEHLRAILENMPPYKLTFLGAKFLESGDYEFAKAALEEATQKDRFYRDAFRYYAYVLQAVGDNDQAELALRRAKTLDPREP